MSSVFDNLTFSEDIPVPKDFGLKLPFMIQIFSKHLLYHPIENHFLQNYGTRFGFNVIAAK